MKEIWSQHYAEVTRLLRYRALSELLFILEGYTVARTLRWWWNGMDFVITVPVSNPQSVCCQQHRRKRFRSSSFSLYKGLHVTIWSCCCTVVEFVFGLPCKHLMGLPSLQRREFAIAYHRKKRSHYKVNKLEYLYI